MLATAPFFVKLTVSYALFDSLTTTYVPKEYELS